MARQCEPGPEPPHEAHRDSKTAAAAPLPMNDVDSGTASNVALAATVVITGRGDSATMAMAAAAMGAAGAAAISCAAKSARDGGGEETCGNGGFAINGEGGREGGAGALSTSLSNRVSRGGGGKQRAEVGAAASTPLPQSAHATGVAMAVEEISPNLPATAAAAAAAPPVAALPCLLLPPAGAGAAAPSGGGGGRSRRRRKNAAKAAAAAVGAAATAKPSDDNDLPVDVEEEAGLGATGRGGLFGAGMREGGGMAEGRAKDVCKEDDEGNVEYKLKLVNPPLVRLEHLFTQMNWRLNEGRGECMYMLGYEDHGKATGISPSELSASIKTLRAMMEVVGAKIANMEVQAGAGGGKLKVARVTVVRQATLFDGLPPDSERRGLRVGVLGHAGAGKSTLVSVLTRGMSDNGRGLARMQVLRHNHEVFNGQTSSISQQALTLTLANRETVATQPRSNTPAALGGRSTNVQGALPQQSEAVRTALPGVAGGGGRGGVSSEKKVGGGSGGKSSSCRRNGGSAGGVACPTADEKEGGRGSNDLRDGGEPAAAAAAADRGALGLAPPPPPPPSSTSSPRMLSSSFPRPSPLEGASASNGFASAWARKGRGNTGGGGGGDGNRRRGNSMDESGWGPALRRRQGGGLGDDDDEGESRVLTFIDQPGHEKYLKTTLTGMTASALDYSMLVVSGVEGVQRMTREHLAIALALQLPIFVVMTKSDVAGSLSPGMSFSQPHAEGTAPFPARPKPQSLRIHEQAITTSTPAAQTATSEMLAALQGIDRVLWACMGRRAKIVGGVEDAEAAADALRGGGSSRAAGGTSWEGLVPVVQVSSVTSNGFAELRAFLARLSPPEPLEAMYKEARGKAAEVRISNTFMVEGVGEVYAGNVVSGTVSVGDRLMLGPTGPKGAFIRTAVASVHVARLAVRRASAGQTASFTLVEDPDPDGEGPEEEGGGEAGGLVVVREGLEVPSETENGIADHAHAHPDSGAAPRAKEEEEEEAEGGWGVEQQESGADVVDVASPLSRTGGGSGGVGVPSRGSPPLFDGGGGDGESPSRRIRKGMVLVEATGRPSTCYEFEAEVMILHHPGVIRENYQPVVHAHNICQSARITSMVTSATAEPPPTTTTAAKSATPTPARAPPPADFDVTRATQARLEGGGGGRGAAGRAELAAPFAGAVTGTVEAVGEGKGAAGAIEPATALVAASPAPGIKSGERAVCRFRFLYRPEYLAVGTTIVLREGRTRGFGKVISVQ